MVTTASRQSALERRKALSTAGKAAASRYAKTRQRTLSDGPGPKRGRAGARTVAATPRPRPIVIPQPVAIAPPVPPAAQNLNTHKISNPTRDLALARRRALSRQGKRNDTSRDRIRTEVRRPSRTTPQPPAADHQDGNHTCDCQRRPQKEARTLNRPLKFTSPSTGGRSAAEARLKTPKGKNGKSPSRALVLARRQAMSKHGKSANAPTSASSAAVARQGNPELSGRELAQRVRELKARSGSAGQCIKGNNKRPCGPRRGMNRPRDTHQGDQAADAHWKVGASTTPLGQTVTGTRTDRSIKTTGNEASTCRTITGTEYMGADVFQAYCQSQAPSRPRKVAVTPTGYGNTVTGTEVGRSVRVTGDEPGTCKAITGTQYLSGSHGETWCGSPTPPQPAKVGQAQTQAEQRVSGTLVGRSAKVTGDEPGSGHQLTGSQYMNPTPAMGRGPAPVKVHSFSTLRGAAVTGNEVGRSLKVTGDEPGACKTVTGDDYVGRQQYDAFCQNRPAPEAAKVGLSTTNRNQTVSGTSTGRSPLVTGDEPGACKAVTGTPYAGLEQAGNFCSGPEQIAIVARTPAGPGTPGQPMTGLQPGIGGVMTGAERGACEPISGTPYVGADQFRSACGEEEGQGVPADLPQPLEGAPWTRFTITSPFRAAHTEQKRRLVTGVTGTLYERGGTRITGPFGMAGGRVTGTEEFRFDQRSTHPSLPPRNPLQPLVARKGASAGDASPVPTPSAPSRVTGEGMVQGVRISGNDWSRNDRVTGTEGPSSRRRNPSRPGPMSAMAPFQPKRNGETEVPLSPITGSSGNTDKGAVVTFSGGARG